jgi:hypothetical protein
MVGLPPGLGWIGQSPLEIDLAHLDLRVEGSDTYGVWGRSPARHDVIRRRLG